MSSATPEQQLKTLRDMVVRAQDLMSELQATLTSLHLNEVSDGFVGEQANRVALALWRCRWEAGPSAGDVREDCAELEAKEEVPT
jgi:hypothetical protein